MFGLVTKAAYDAAIAEREDTIRSLVIQRDTAKRQRDTMRDAYNMARASYVALKAKTHTTRGPNGRYVKAEVQA